MSVRFGRLRRMLAGSQSWKTFPCSRSCANCRYPNWSTARYHVIRASIARARKKRKAPVSRTNATVERSAALSPKASATFHAVRLVGAAAGRFFGTERSARRRSARVATRRAYQGSCGRARLARGRLGCYAERTVSVPFSPLVAEWFVERFGTPTPAQDAGWPRIAAGEDTLIAAPTGSGKTL